MDFEIFENLIELELRPTSHQVVCVSVVLFYGDDVQARDLELFFPLSHRLDSLDFFNGLVHFHCIERIKGLVEVLLEPFAGRFVIAPVMNLDPVGGHKLKFEFFFGIAVFHELDGFEEDSIDMKDFDSLLLVHFRFVKLIMK